MLIFYICDTLFWEALRNLRKKSIKMWSFFSTEGKCGEVVTVKLAGHHDWRRKKMHDSVFFVDQCATNIHTNISGLSLLFANTQSQLHRGSRAHRVYSIVKYILTDFLTAICICLTIPLEYHKNVKPIFDVNKWWGDHNLLEWWKKTACVPTTSIQHVYVVRISIPFANDQNIKALKIDNW